MRITTEAASLDSGVPLSRHADFPYCALSGQYVRAHRRCGVAAGAPRGRSWCLLPSPPPPPRCDPPENAPGRSGVEAAPETVPAVRALMASALPWIMPIDPLQPSRVSGHSGPGLDGPGMLFAPDTDLEAFLMSRCRSLALVNGKRSLAPGDRGPSPDAGASALCRRSRTGTAMASISPPYRSAE